MSANAVKYLAGNRIFWRLRSLAIVFSLWEWAGRIPISPAFPPFTDTARAMWVMLADGTLFSTYVITLQPLVLGILICGIGGVTLGITMGLSKTFEWFTLPIFIIVRGTGSRNATSIELPKFRLIVGELSLASATRSFQCMLK